MLERERDYEDGEAAKDIERGYASVAALLLLLFCFSLAYELVIGHSHGEERCVVNHGKRDLYAQRIRTLWYAASDSPTAQRKRTKRMNTKRQRYSVFFITAPQYETRAGGGWFVRRFSARKK